MFASFHSEATFFDLLQDISDWVGKQVCVLLGQPPGYVIGPLGFSWVDGGEFLEHGDSRGRAQLKKSPGY